MDKNGFINYMESKDFSQNTIKKRVMYVERFFAIIAKEDIQVSKPDVLYFLEYLKKNYNTQNSYLRHNLDALNHYFCFLQKNGVINKNPCQFLKIRGQKRKTLYRIYTPEELDLLFDAYYLLFVRNYDDSKHRYMEQRQYSHLCRERNSLILSILINQGTATGEIGKIELDDLDLTKATLKIRDRLHSNERTIPLKATQIGLFINYLQNIRPKLVDHNPTDSNKLFLFSSKNIGKNHIADKALLSTCCELTKMLKSIDKKFVNFKQVRASIITFWLKTQGLRKTQYLAGHRYISSTESYLINDMDSLVEDINKLNPF